MEINAPRLVQATCRALVRLARLRSVWAVLCIALVVAGCGGRNKPGLPQERITLRVDNRGYYDVTVYAVRSAGSSGTRLGNVSGGSSGTLFVRITDLQPGGRLVVRLRALGTRRSWTSPAVSVADGLRARLSVMSSNSGDMSQSTLIADFTGGSD
jgi:hypothetical protein